MQEWQAMLKSHEMSGCTLAPMPGSTVIIHISGRVQGVYFRESARRKAAELGITGTARNLPDGRVEIVAQGVEAQVDEFIQWCHQGPPASRVDHVLVKPEAYQEFSEFSVIR